MSRQNFTEGQEIVTQDLNAISQGLEETLLDNVIWPLIAAAAGFFGNGFYVTYDSSTGVTVSEGWGIQRDANQSDPEPMTRILVNDDDSTIYAIETPDATNDRIDIVQVKWEIENGATGTREFKAAGGSVGDATAQLRKDWSADIQIKTGTPAGSPSAPTVDTGYVKIAELYVTASTGIANQAAITDFRNLIRTDFHLHGEINASQAAAHTLAFNSPEDVFLDSPTTTVNQDLPKTGVRAGKKFTFHLSNMIYNNKAYVIRSANGDTIKDYTAYNSSVGTADAKLTVIALQDNPNTSDHWQIIHDFLHIEYNLSNSVELATDANNIVHLTVIGKEATLSWDYNLTHDAMYNPESASFLTSPLRPRSTVIQTFAVSSSGIDRFLVSSTGFIQIQHFTLAGAQDGTKTALGTVGSVSWRLE